MTEKARERIVPSCVEALENYQQADEDGIMVLASRQAIHETIDAYWALVDTCEALTAERDALAAEVERLRGKLERAVYVLGGVRGAIKTGRNEPLVIWAEQIDIAIPSLEGKDG